MRHLFNFKHRRPAAGFTLIEVLVIAPIMILTIGAFVTLIVSMTGEVLASRASTILAYNVQDALNRIEQDVKLSSTFLDSNSITLTSPQGLNDDTTAFVNASSTTGTKLILNTIATSGNPIDASSSYVYLANQPNACASTQVTQNTPMSLNIIYFVKDETLWRRVLAPADYASIGCNTPWQQPSCYPGVSGAFCKTQDIRLVDNIDPSDFVIEYYNGANAGSPNTTAGDPLASDVDRRTALQSATTISASINVDTTAAGRDIGQHSSLRVSRLDVNASALAAVVPNTLPSTPVASATFEYPTTAKISWPTSTAGATTYTLDYNINGGSWTNAFTASTNTSYSFTAGHGQTVNFRVKAGNPIGESSYATASTSIPLFTPMVLQNSWAEYGTPFAAPAYTKTSNGMVILRGLVKGGTTTTGTIVATLPAGYRPDKRLVIENSSNATFGRTDITSDGEILFQVGSSGWFSFDGLNFMVSGTSFTALTPFSNSWTNYATAQNQSQWATAGYMIDSVGRVHTQGLVSSGTVTDGTIIVNLPSGARPASYEHTASISNNAHGAVGITSGGDMVAKGGANNYLGFQSVFYPSAFAGWTTLTLQNSWVAYGGIYSTPRYTKAADGTVMLKGLIKSGAVTAGTVIATLPAGHCPKQRLLLTAVISGAWGRIDLLPAASAGATCDLITSNVSSTWTSLDNVLFMNEW